MLAAARNWALKNAISLVAAGAVALAVATLALLAAVVAVALPSAVEALDFPAAVESLALLEPQSPQQFEIASWLLPPGPNSRQE